MLLSSLVPFAHILMGLVAYTAKSSPSGIKPSSQSTRPSFNRGRRNIRTTRSPAFQAHTLWATVVDCSSPLRKLGSVDRAHEATAVRHVDGGRQEHRKVHVQRTERRLGHNDGRGEVNTATHA